jgi:hypothetical protein
MIEEKKESWFADIFFETFYGIKFWIQRMWYGYSEDDVWNLNSYLIDKIYWPLKTFVKDYEEHGMALPREFASDPGAWLMILKKMELAFDSAWADEFEEENRFTKGMNEEQIKEHKLQVEEGFTLFGKYMRDLYDY